MDRGVQAFKVVFYHSPKIIYIVQLPPIPEII